MVALFPALWYGEGKGVVTMREQQTLGRRIQEARKAAGLSQESLGERLGVSRQAVSKWDADLSLT